MPFPPKLSFASFLQYSPRPQTGVERVSKSICLAIKNDGQITVTFKDGSTKPVNAIDWAARHIASGMHKHPFLKNYLGKNAILVPIPRSSPLFVKTALWPSKRICEALCDVELGSEMI